MIDVATDVMPQAPQGSRDAGPLPMRLAVYYDTIYWRDGERLTAEKPFVVFLLEMAQSVRHLELVGRLQPTPGTSHYVIPEHIRFTGLPFYSSTTRPLEFARAFAQSITRFWRVLDRSDVVWLMGPHLLAVVYALMAMARRKRVVLGVRQDLPSFVRNRHPHKRWVHRSASVLERVWRLLARRAPATVSGPDLARNYRCAPHLMQMSIALVRERDIVAPAAALARRYDGDLQILSVGRIEQEKNPLLLADVMARLAAEPDGDRWRMVVCGVGRMQQALAERLVQLGVADRVDLRGHVPADYGLLDIYRASHILLHVSWTEGIPQVLFEAFAAGLPVVATAVGGVSEAAGHLALLVPPGNPDAIVEKLHLLRDDANLRASRIASGIEHARGLTMETECRRVAEFLYESTR
jgi:glycosyltransferase involved in cell wall biosynthesis